MIAARTGTPTTSARGRPGSGTADNTRLAVRAPTRLASPALALASWITTGTRRPGRVIPLAAKYAGSDTYPPKPITTSASTLCNTARVCRTARITRSGRRAKSPVGLRGNGTGVISSSA